MVYIKELMHLFDDPMEAVDSGDTFETVLREILPGPSQPSPQILSEYNCFWMALGVLCPERLRLELARERTEGRIDDYAIALRLRIPQQYVARLFEDRYLDIINRLVRS